MDKVILSMHFEKCGGTTLRYFWKKSFNDSEFFLYEPHLYEHNVLIEEIDEGVGQYKDVKVIHGHFAHGLHLSLTRPCEYVCVLRDPVDRFISHFNHWREWGQAPAGSNVTGQKITIEEFLEDPSSNSIRNLMTKRLAGLGLTTDATCEDFEEAAKNLSAFSAVGFVDNLPEFGKEIAHKFGLKDANCDFKLNSQRLGTVKHKLPKETLEKIEILNYWDRRLYNSVVK